MKAKISAENYRVTLSYDEEDICSGETVRVERVFTCPQDGGYVREYRDGDWKQVCDRLGSMGSTLSCSSRENLLALIRREYQAMRRAEKREKNARNAY